MLFNSYAFIFAFLPIVGIGYFWLARRATNLALVWLLLSSMLFYGWWSWSYLGLIVASFVANYLFAIFLAQHRSLILLSFGVGLNLAVLGWFKYANFTADNLNVLFDLGINLAPIVLPLAISFHTFQQIAYLVDVKRGVEPEPNLLRYGLFVCFFPQLLAGPIVHHHEMLPQLKGWRQALRHEDLAVGVTIFLIGLAKKTLIADRMAAYASPMFDAAATGLPISLLDAWAGVLAYTLQIYFDFSGYSDMAIGLARMFGIRLPMNFNSPYKAASIIEFWRRWHITLSRFLRDYLYVPLGGNRHGGGAPICQSDGCHAAGRVVARRQLDLRGLGRAAWLISCSQSWLASFERGLAGSGAVLAVAGDGVAVDLSVCDARLGVFSCRQF